MTEKQSLLAQFDDAWSHKWESFNRISKDLTEEEVRYQHPSFAGEEREEGWPPPGTILWQLAHLEYWQRYYLDTLGIMAPNRNMPNAIEPVSLDDVMKRLLETRSRLREKIASLSDEEFANKIGPITVSEFIRMMTRHDTWHASQIALARRLYRTREVLA